MLILSSQCLNLIQNNIQWFTGKSGVLFRILIQAGVKVLISVFYSESWNRATNGLMD